MPNQLIQDPDKASLKKNEVTFKDIAEPISYFLAGSFLISTGLPQQLVESTAQSTDLFTCVVGGFLILSGFIFIIANFPLKNLTSFREQFKRIYNKYIYTLLFIITIAKLIFTTIDFANYPPLFYIGFIFLIMVLLEIIVTIGNVRKLLLANLILYLLAFYLMFTQADKLKLITIFAISFFTFIVTICRVWNKVAPQNKES